MYKKQYIIVSIFVILIDVLKSESNEYKNFIETYGLNETYINQNITLFFTDTIKSINESSLSIMDKRNKYENILNVQIGIIEAECEKFPLFSISRRFSDNKKKIYQSIDVVFTEKENKIIHEKENIKKYFPQMEQPETHTKKTTTTTTERITIQSTTGETFIDPNDDSTVLNKTIQTNVTKSTNQTIEKSPKTTVPFKPKYSFEREHKIIDRTLITDQPTDELVTELETSHFSPVTERSNMPIISSTTKKVTIQSTTGEALIDPKEVTNINKSIQNNVNKSTIKNFLMNEATNLKDKQSVQSTFPELTSRIMTTRKKSSIKKAIMKLIHFLGRSNNNRFFG